jgi:tetratricopeptide (TPR) repeat protein
LIIFLLTNRNLTASFLVSAIFAVHPMHVESVAWISERKDVLYSFFFLLALIAYILFKKGGGKKYYLLIITFLLFIFSCLSKGTAVILPVILLLTDSWLNRTYGQNSVKDSLIKAFSVKNLLILVPFFLVSLFTGLLTYRLQNGQNFLGILDLSATTPDVVNQIGPFTLLHRFGIGAYGFVSYLIKFFVPSGLSALYPYPDTADFTASAFQVKLAISSIILLAIGALTLLSLRKRMLFAFGMAFYFFTALLVLQFITVGMAIMADRYTYLPYIGLAFIPAVLISESPVKWRNAGLIIAGLFLVILVVLSKQRTGIWQNTEVLWTNVIDKYPDVELPRRSRAKYYSKISLETADASLRRSYEDKALTDFNVAISSGTNSADVYEGAGVICSSKGDYTKALSLIGKAIDLDPEKGSAYYNRALVFTALGRKDEAIEDYNSALMYRPGKAKEIINNRANLLLETGRYKEAIRDLDYLISGDRNNFLFYYNRGFSKQQTFDIVGAIEDYQRALQIQPGDQITREQLRTLTGR